MRSVMEQSGKIKPWEQFECDECGDDFPARWIDGDPLPDCPTCWKAQQASRDRIAEMVESGIATPTINTVHGADIAYREMERNGHTDMKDNLREGDHAVMTTQRSRVEEDALVRAELERMTSIATQKPNNPNVKASWAAVPSRAGADQALAQGKAYTDEAKAAGQVDPIFGSDGKNKLSRTPPLRVISRADRNGNVMGTVRKR